MMCARMRHAHTRHNSGTNWEQIRDVNSKNTEYNQCLAPIYSERVVSNPSLSATEFRRRVNHLGRLAFFVFACWERFWEQSWERLQLEVLLDDRWDVRAVATDPLAVAALDHGDGGVTNVAGDPVQRDDAQG